VAGDGFNLNGFVPANVGRTEPCELRQEHRIGLP